MLTSHSGTTGRLLAFFALGVVGSYCFMILPLVVAALTASGTYSARTAGFIGSAPLVGMFIGSIASAAVVHRIPWRATIATAVLGLSAANVFSWLAVGSLSGLCVAQFAVGFTGVVLMSIAFAYIGQTAAPIRNFGWFIALQMSAGALATLLVERVSASGGAGAVFRILAIITSLALPLALAIPNAQRKHAGDEVVHGATPVPGLWRRIAVLATQIAFGAGVMLIWSCAARIGAAHGFSSQSVAKVLSFSLVTSIGGALAASAIARRVSVSSALMLGTATMVVATALSVVPGASSVFATGLALFGFGWNFLPAFQLGISANVDPSGRLVVLNIALVKLGYAIGAAAAAVVAGPAGRYGINAALATGCFAVALATSSFANRAVSRPDSSAQA